MTVRVGSAIFEKHVSLEIAPNKWTDMFVFLIRHNVALPPWDYAEAVNTVMPTLEKFRRGASLWVPVIAPGRWYLDEAKYALRNAFMPVALTCGEKAPGILDFSRPPGIYDVPCKAGTIAESTPFRLLLDIGMLIIQMNSFNGKRGSCTCACPPEKKHTGDRLISPKGKIGFAYFLACNLKDFLDPDKIIYTFLLKARRRNIL